MMPTRHQRSVKTRRRATPARPSDRVTQRTDRGNSRETNTNIISRPYNILVIERSLSDVTKADIDSLITEKRVEDRRLEYKSTLPGTSDKEKKEFLADISAFANGAGGDVLYGVQESAGIPVSADGVPIVDFDAERARLQNMIREGIQPRIPSVEMRSVGEFEKGFVFIVRVRQSWVAPHMVTFAGNSRFFARDAGQRHMMDVQELRAAFVGSEGVGEKLRAFRDERLARVLARSTPVPIEPHPVALLHLLPIGAHFLSSLIDPRGIGDHWLKLISTEFVQAANTKINFEGFLIYGSPTLPTTQETNAYIQLYRNGAIEALTTLRPSPNGRIELVGRHFEHHLVKVIEAFLVVRKDLMIRGDLLVFLSLLGAQRVALYQGDPFQSSGRVFERDLMLFPDVLIEEEIVSVGRVLRPIFDLMWQAAGFKGSPSYDDAGDWQQPRR